MSWLHLTLCILQRNLWTEKSCSHNSARHTFVKGSHSIFMVHHNHSFQHVWVYLLIFHNPGPKLEEPIVVQTFGFPCPIILVRSTSKGNEMVVAAAPATHPLTKFTTESHKQSQL